MPPTDLPTTATPPPPHPDGLPDTLRTWERPRWVHVALFFGCAASYRLASPLASKAAEGFALRFDMWEEQPVLEAAALLFLVVLAIAVLRAIERTVVPLRWSMGLPKRKTSAEEWGTGAAIGWTIAVISGLMMLLGRVLHVQLWTAPHAFALLAMSAISLALLLLAKLLALYGYGFQHLIEGIGAGKATLLLVALVAADSVLSPSPYGVAETSKVLVSAAGALLLALCWQRTRAVWMGWGGWFAWAASTALLFGLPLGAGRTYAGVVDGRAVQPVWLTGGAYGPLAAGFLLVLLVAAIPVVVRVTDEYAWRYARRPIVPAGIAVEIPAPAAHVAMEAPVEAAPALVQIQPIASATGRTEGASS